jgi:hypothetical protein
MDVSKLDTSIIQEMAGTNLLRRSSMTSNEMAKDMLKGKFESSLCLLDKNYNSPGKQVDFRNSLGLKGRNNERTSTAFTNIRNKMVSN